MPVAPHAAVIPGKYYHTGLFHQLKLIHQLIIIIAYTEAINLLNYSVVTIPVTKADKTLDPFDHSYEPLNEVDRKNWKACKCVSQSPVQGLNPV